MCVLKLTLTYTSMQKFGHFLEINTFIHQECIQLIKSVFKDIYNITNDFY